MERAYCKKYQSLGDIVFEITSTNIKLEACAKAMKQKYLFDSPIILEENSDNDKDSITVEEDEIKEVSWEGKKNGAPQPEIGPGYVMETKKSQFVCDSKTRSVLQMVKSIDVDEGGKQLKYIMEEFASGKG